MEAFKEYLIDKGYKESTTEEIIRSVKIFLDWTKQNRITQPVYEHILKYLEEKEIKAGTKNNVVLHLKRYFDYLISEGRRKDNPAKDIRIRHDTKTMSKQISEREMELIFEKYRYRKLRESKQVISHRRNLCLLGLILYQALTSKELSVLRKSDVDLTEGTVSIPDTERSNGRVLKLEARQMNVFNEFMEQCDEFLLERKADYVMNEIMDHLKKIGYRRINLQQLRSSRIMIWIRSYKIREVQCMTGFKYLSSLQKYQDQDVESLKEKVKLFHPMR